MTLCLKTINLYNFTTMKKVLPAFRKLDDACEAYNFDFRVIASGIYPLGSFTAKEFSKSIENSSKRIKEELSVMNMTLSDVPVEAGPNIAYLKKPEKERFILAQTLTKTIKSVKQNG